MSLNKIMTYLCCSKDMEKKNEKLVSEIKKSFNLESIENYDPKRESKIILLGGDGSINYLINLIDDLSKAQILYIPTGTANDFAKSIKLNRKIENAQQIKDIFDNAHTLSIPIMKCNEQRFINVATAGLPAQVTNSGSDLLKKITGKISYYINSIESVIKTETFHFDLKSNKEKKSFNTFGFIISQGLYAGGGVKTCLSFCPNFNDSFEFLTIKDQSITNCIGKIISIQNDDYMDDQEDNLLFRKKFHSEIKIVSNRPIPIKLDGEEYKAKVINFYKEKDKVEFFFY